MSRKYIDISRVVTNAETLSIPEISDSFFYGGCDDMDGLSEVIDEIDNVKEMLPEGIYLLDLPCTYCGNRKTKIYGLATCAATEGHQILKKDAPFRVIFEDEDEAEKLGYRPCLRCMQEEYLEWKEQKK